MAAKVIQPDWDALVTRYNHDEFIPNDPISFPHRYKDSSDWRNIECVAFLAALFSYGRREKILETVAGILDKLGEDPVSELMLLSARDIQKLYSGFYYRFNVADDLVFVLRRLSDVYQEHGSLKALWESFYPQSEDLRHSISYFRHVFLHQGRVKPPDTSGMKFLFADPMQNSAAKRFNMFLRWMVREDAVDFGLWGDVMSPAELLIPLDTHVAAMARKYQITRRKSNDWKTAEEITGYFGKFCPEDPVRYDFALFGLGITKDTSPEGPANR